MLFQPTGKLKYILMLLFFNVFFNNILFNSFAPVYPELQDIHDLNLKYLSGVCFVHKGVEFS